MHLISVEDRRRVSDIRLLRDSCVECGTSYHLVKYKKEIATPAPMLTSSNDPQKVLWHIKLYIGKIELIFANIHASGIFQQEMKRLWGMKKDSQNPGRKKLFP